MAEYVTAIRTAEGDKQIDYVLGIANKPDIPSNVVQYVQQDLTDEQKAQVRNNIGVTGLKHAEQHISGDDRIYPSDIGAASIPTMQRVTLVASDWSEETNTLTDEIFYKQTVSVQGVSSEYTKQWISISPVPATEGVYVKSGITAVEQDVDALTFTAAVLPNINVLVYVVIQDIAMQKGVSV